jgi:hypothetical protein
LSWVVAGYDAYFAWRYWEVFQSWEWNALARWLALACGLGALLAVKAALLVFALGVAVHCRRCQHWLEVPLTLIVSCVHLVLGALYAIGHLQPLWQ